MRKLFEGIKDLFKGLLRIVRSCVVLAWEFICDPYTLVILLMALMSIVFLFTDINNGKQRMRVAAERTRVELEAKQGVLGKVVTIEGKPYTAINAWYSDGHHWVRLSGPGGEFTWEWKPELEK